MLCSSSLFYTLILLILYYTQVCRVVMRDLCDKGLLFAKAAKELFPAPWKFGTDNVSHIEE